MKITLLQTNIKWQSPSENRTHLEKLIETSPNSDLLILPEMFTTGFCTSPKGVAEKANTDTLQWMQNIAKNKNMAIGGSVATEENGKYYNRFYFVKPNGEYSTYDKHHLFSFAAEHKEYEAGQKRVIVGWKGFRILLQICYDLRFPVFSRNKGDYDMIIYVASWPVTRIDAWNTLLKARAIENQCYVAGVNRVGDDPGNHYSGGTALIDFLGKTISYAEDEKEGFAYVELNIEEQNAFRAKFPALADADEFRII